MPHQPSTDRLGNEVDSIPSHLFESAVEQSPLAISITDLNANILYCNEAFTEVTGYSREEILGNNEAVLSYKSTPRHIYQEMWQVISDKRPWRGTLINRRKNGERYLAELMIAPVLDSEGEISHYLGLHRDGSGIHALQQRVANQKALIESVVDSAPDAIAVLDQNYKVLLDNHAYKKLVGDMRGGEPVVKLFAAIEEDDPGFAQLLKRRDGFNDREVECRLGREGARRWFSCSGTWFYECSSDADDFFRQPDVPYLMLSVHEITQQKRRQEEVRRNAMRALMAEEDLNTSMRETLSAAAYKLQEPLNMLNAAIALINKKRSCSEGSEQILQLLSEIREMGEEGLELLHRTMPHESGEENAQVNLNQLLHEVVQYTTPRLLAEGIVIEWRPESSLPPITGSPRQLRTLFRHLLNNAIEAIVDATDSSREIAIHSGREGEWVSFTISDSGNGIDESLRYKVFEPFFTTKHSFDRAHSGMGLTLVQEAANAHAGTIEIGDNDNGGCQIKLRLPIARP